MPTLATAATGIQLKIASNVIPELRTLSEVGAQFNVVDVSAHDGGDWASKIPTFLDGGTIRATFNFVPGNAQHIALRTAMLGRTSVAMSVVLPTTGNPAWTFNAFVTRYRIPAAPVNGELSLDVELTVDGIVNFS